MAATKDSDMELMRQALEALNTARREHRDCDDSWYSCPKSPEGTSNDNKGDECDCGADKVNAVIDPVIASLERRLATHSHLLGFEYSKRIPGKLLI